MPRRKNHHSVQSICFQRAYPIHRAPNRTQTCSTRRTQNANTCTPQARLGRVATNIATAATTVAAVAATLFSVGGGGFDTGMLQRAVPRASRWRREDAPRAVAGVAVVVGCGAFVRVKMSGRGRDELRETRNVDRSEIEDQNDIDTHADVLGDETLRETEDSSTPLREAFAGSRAEWTSAPAAVSPSPSPSSSSTTYSHSYKRSRKASSTVSETGETDGDGKSAESETSEMEEVRWTRDASVLREREWAEGNTRNYKDKLTERDIDDERPVGVSSGDLVKRLLGSPGWVLHEVVVPIAQVGAVVWYDTKMALLDMFRGERGYFVKERTNGEDGDGLYGETSQSDDAGRSDAQTDEYVEHDERRFDDDEEEVLSVEEQQVLLVQRAAERAAQNAERAAKTLGRSVFRLFDENKDRWS